MYPPVTQFETLELRFRQERELHRIRRAAARPRPGVNSKARRLAAALRTRIGWDLARVEVENVGTRRRREGEAARTKKAPFPGPS